MSELWEAWTAPPELRRVLARPSVGAIGAVIVLLALLVYLVRTEIRPLPSSVELQEKSGASILVARDAQGKEVWRKNVPDGSTVPILGAEGKGPLPFPFLLRRGTPYGIAVPLQDPKSGSVLLLQAKTGHTVWTRRLEAQPRWPDHPMRWVAKWVTGYVPRGSHESIIVIETSDAQYAPSRVQFLSLSNDSLASYYHHGYLYFDGPIDADGDGREEVLLYGYSNGLKANRELFPFDRNSNNNPACYVLLDPLNTNGKGFPYVGWEGVPCAKELAYLAVPPLYEDLPVSLDEPLRIQDPDGKGFMFRLPLGDGRILIVDSTLRPLECDLPSQFPLRRRLREQEVHSFKVLWVREGEQETVEVDL